MADTPDQTKAQTNATAETPKSAAADEGLLSIENLEAVIAEADPEFSKAFADIGAAENAADLNLELIDLDQLLAEEEARSIKARAKKFWANFKFRLVNFVVSIRQLLILFVKETAPRLIKFILGKISAFFASINETLRQFRYKPVKYKASVFGFIFLVIATGFYIHRAIKHSVFPEADPLFINSMAELATAENTWDSAVNGESLYDSVRSSANLFLVQKIVVNIKSSPSSGPNPMAACDLFLEGNSPDVVVELKDREVEIKDSIQRDIEELSFAQLSSPEGKKYLSERIRRNLNRILSRGKLKNVYFNTFIIKP